MKASGGGKISSPSHLTTRFTRPATWLIYDASKGGVDADPVAPH